MGLLDSKLARDYDGQVFYKISKSCLDIAKYCCEPYFTKYIPKTIVRDTGEHYLCYVPGQNIIGCIPYGDLLTEIVFDSTNPMFELIADEEVFFVGGAFNEYRSRAVLTGQSYSLSDPNTIKRIIDMTPDVQLRIRTKTDCKMDYLSIAQHLEKLGFYRSLEYWNTIVARYQFTQLKA